MEEMMSKEQLYHYNDTIDQLQQENEQLKKELAEKEQEISDLQKENELLRRALELACETHSENDKAYKIKSKQRSANKYFDYFIQQAKEELRDENIGRNNRTEL